MSSDKKKTGDSSQEMSSDLMKKLNDAFSSYIDGENTTKDIDVSSEKDSLLELIRLELAEKKSKDEAEKKIKDEAEHLTDGQMVYPTEEPNEAAEPSSFIMEKGDDNNSDIDPEVADVLSGVFDDVIYQSVDIEVVEKDSPAEVVEQADYSGIVFDILKKNQKVSDLSFPGDRKADLADITLSGTQLTEKDEKLANELQDASELKGVRKTGFETGSGLANNPLSDAMAGSKSTIPKTAKVIKTAEAIKTAANTVSTDNTDSGTDLQFLKEHTKQPAQGHAVESKRISKTISPRSSDISAKMSSLAAAGAKESRVSKPPAIVSPENIDVPAKIAFLYNKDHTLHDPSSLSIITHERPERIIKAMWYLEKHRVFTDGTCTLIDRFDHASEEALLRVHETSYVSFVQSYASAGGGFLGDSTYMTSGSYDVARLAAGAAIRAGDLLMDRQFSHAFVLARPPGHHASSQKYGGFCLFNNAAILARHLQSRRNVGRILILDWDAHAGDGTMEIFYEDPTVFFVSLHRDPHTFYPRRGFSTQIGENAGRGYNMNVEMPSGAGNDEYALAFDEVVVPLIRHFSPEFMIISCGFDAYYQEKNVGLELDSQGYHQMTSKIREVFGGPMVFIMEGGYHDFNGQLCHSVLSSLHGRPNPVNDHQEISSYRQNQRKQVFSETLKKVEESKKNSPVLSLRV
ncbi:histone deacetylase [Methanolobus sp. WCC5]|uniref:histone deacetylase family protein n=1 Tax=Methanolobus sp. WCC5 TaxID=3125785 RepID=UPI003244E5D2